MKIRRAEEKDTAAVDRLLSQVLEIHAQLRPDLFIPGTRKYTDEELHEIFHDEDRPVFAAVDDEDNVMGYIFCMIQNVDSSNMHKMKTLYIDDLCVDAAYRHQKVGNALVQYAKAYAKQIGCHNVTLHVWEGNDSARKFYEKEGFGIQKTTMEIVLE